MKWSQICRMVPQRGLARGNEIPYQISRIRERVSGKRQFSTSGVRRSGFGIRVCRRLNKKECVAKFAQRISSASPHVNQYYYYKHFANFICFPWYFFISNCDFCFNLLSVLR